MAKEKVRQIPYLNDIMQSKGKLTHPEIRVWCHPHRINKKGDDYFKVFNSFSDAENFIIHHKEAEDSPVIAFAGKEVNLYAMLTW